MAAPPRKPRLTAEQRRALQLLARSARGTTEAIILAHGFSRRTLSGLIRAGLAKAQRETIKAGSQPVEVGRYARSREEWGQTSAP